MQNDEIDSATHEDISVMMDCITFAEFVDECNPKEIKACVPHPTLYLWPFQESTYTRESYSIGYDKNTHQWYYDISIN